MTMTAEQILRMRDKKWNRCDVCGRFIAFTDFETGAIRRLITPDSHFSREEYETLCREHSDDHDR